MGGLAGTVAAARTAGPTCPATTPRAAAASTPTTRSARRARRPAPTTMGSAERDDLPAPELIGSCLVGAHCLLCMGLMDSRGPAMGLAWVECQLPFEALAFN